MGLFFTHKSPNNNVMQFISKNDARDQKYPIVGNSITRSQIYHEIWLAASNSLTERFAQQNLKVNTDSIYYKILAITQIIAFVLNKKKPQGLASQTKNTGRLNPKNKSDKELQELKQIQKKLDQFNPSNDLKEFLPDFDSEFSNIKTLYDSLIKKYDSLTDRNTYFSNEVIFAIHDLRMNPCGLSDREIKIFIIEASSYFEDQNYTLYHDLINIEPLFREQIDFVQYHDEGMIQRYKSPDKTKSIKRISEMNRIDKKIKSK